MVPRFPSAGSDLSSASGHLRCPGPALHAGLRRAPCGDREQPLSLQPPSLLPETQVAWELSLS